MDRHNRKYNTETGLENFILRLKEYNPDLEYYSDYIDSDSKVKLKCNKCGNIFERYASCVRKNSKIRCFECEKIETQRRKQKENKHFITIDGQQLQIKECLNCGNYFITDIRYKKYCNRRCTNRAKEFKHTRLRIEKAKENGRIDKSITLDKLIKRDNNICYICNRECNLNDYTYNGNTFIAGNYYPSIDHVVPLAKGGTHTWDNVRLAHRICNSFKSDK